MEIDYDELQEIERRLVSDVRNKVERSLFKRYIAMGSFVIAVLGFFGWNVLSGIEQHAKTVAEAAAKAQTKPVIDAAKENLRNVIANSNAEIDKATAAVEMAELAARDAVQRVEFVDKYLERRENLLDSVRADTGKQIRESNELVEIMKGRSDEIDQVLMKWENANSKIAIYQNEVDAFQEKIEAFNEDIGTMQREFANLAGAGNVQELAKDLLRLTASLQSMDAQIGELSGELASTLTLSQAGADVNTLSAIADSVGSQASAVPEVASNQVKATVYFQFAGVNRALAEEISAQLVGRNYKMPGEERTGLAAGKSEIRYFFDEDRSRALEFAENVDSVLRVLSMKDGVQVRDFTNFQGKKPRSGTLELWLEPVPAP